MFGLMMAVSFVFAYWIFSRELKRMEAEGKIRPFKKKVWQDKAPGMNDYLMNFIFYFIAGYKIVEGALFFDELTADPQSFILSGRGNLLGGLAFAALGVYLVYREAQKAKGKTPKEVEVLVHPYQMMGNITFVAAVTGLFGAKLFHILENLSEFRADPIGSIVSASGLTYYGSLICGAIGVLWYVREYIHWRHMLDAGAAGMMLAYAVGRLGCHLSGDGDWGIVNKNPKPGALSWLPDWAWAYNYPNNVNKECNPYPDLNNYHNQVCDWEKTPYLIDPVYPTPIYEVIMGLALFAIMWGLRKKVTNWPGMMFCIYLIFAGIERYIIEQIRVNNIIDFMGMHATQAEIISVIMVLVGVIGGIYFYKKPVEGFAGMK